MNWSYNGRNEFMINESAVTMNEIGPTMVEDTKHRLLRKLYWWKSPQKWGLREVTAHTMYQYHKAHNVYKNNKQ